jgi:uncharacterized protein YbbC (DUF1343 family)
MINFIGRTPKIAIMHMFQMRIMLIVAGLLGAWFFQSCTAGSVESPAGLKTGADQTWLYLPRLEGKSVGLVANHTSLIGRTHLVDTLLKAGIHLIKIYAPEHGFRGKADAGAIIDDAVDPETGIPVVSLYGSKTKPGPDDLKDIDILVYDIQDVGVRFYTYISTLHYVMEACAEAHIPLMILDRPNPLGHYVDGPVLDPAFKSFVGMHPVPVVYGMTVGELAHMINGEGWLAGGVQCDLTVIPCSGYDHNTRYHLPVDPSPNLNSMEAVYLYPSICFFEGTVMSLGRGTPFPFRVAGHPDYPIRTFSFTPLANAGNKNPLFHNRTCYGFDLRSIPLDSLMEIRALNLEWLISAYDDMNLGESFFTGYIDRLAGTGALRKQILSGWREDQIRESWQADLNRFKSIRKKYLLYGDFTVNKNNP